MARGQRKPPETSGSAKQTPTQKDPNRWGLSNWNAGPVTLFQALGIRKGKLQLQSLQPEMTLGQLSLDAQKTQSNNNPAASNNTGGNAPPQTSGTPTVSNVGTGQRNAIMALLKAIGAPASDANIRSMNAWYAHENTGWPPGVQNNPWNTTQPMPGATNWPGNSIGIKQYVSIEQGIQANAITLLNGYPKIVSALRTGNGLCGNQSLGQEFHNWSAGPQGKPSEGYWSVC